MTASPEFPRSVYPLLIVVSTAMMVGHIAGVERVYEPSSYKPQGEAARASQTWPAARPTPTPTLRSNDRSRWATVRALVDDGTYVIGRRERADAILENGYRDRGIAFEDGWQTVDKVLRPETGEFYSSKPPLLATIVAGEYWLLKRALGWSLTDEKQRWWIVRAVLLTFNVLPLVIAFWLMGRLIERWDGSDWTRLFVMSAVCFGTFLTAFAIVLNNHVVAASCGFYALYLALGIWTGARAAWRFLLAGFFAAMAASTELPATSLAVALLFILCYCSFWRTMLIFVPAAALPVAAFFLTNYLAIGQWQLAYSEFGGPWYEYEGSHWKTEPGQVPAGIDWASHKESRAVYVFHFLLGHHGVFSLSPIWLLSLAGITITLLASRERKRPEESSPCSDQILLVALTLVLSLIVVAFYLGRPRWNYGGGTVAPRWLLWLTPFWLLSMLPAVNRLSRSRLGRFFALTLLAVSVFSAAYTLWSPWRHPWLYTWMESQGWIAY